MIAIPNMSKPKNCYQCSFNGGIFCDLIDNDTDAFIKDNPTEVATKVLPDCPLIDIVTCGECKHRPIKDDPDGADYGFNIVEPTDGDDLCPCLVEDGWYSWMPNDNFYCGRGERSEE